MKVNPIAILVMIILVFSSEVFPQGVSINNNGTAPHTSAALDIQSTSKGLLVPRMNFADMINIPDPATGLVIYNTTFNRFYFYNGTGWERMMGNTDSPWTVSGDNLLAGNSGNIGIGMDAPTHKITIQNEYGTNLLRLMGPGSYGHLGKINFGDGEYAYINEFMDDYMSMYAYGGLKLFSDGDVRIVSNFNDVLLSVPGGSLAISTDGSAGNESAILDIQSTSKGMLIPRMTTEQITNINGPADGLQVYNTEDGKLYIFVEIAGVWKEVSFGTNTLAPPFETCGDILTDSRDGQQYQTVDINGQCWMAENLNYGTMISLGSYQINNSIPEKYCYGNNADYCSHLGGLYQWDEMMNYSGVEGSQGICPDDWHVPSDAEWYAMENYLDPVISNPSQTGWRGSTAGQKLKNSGAGPPYNWAYGNTGNNASGFTALPGGLRNTSGYSSANPTNGIFWTSTLNGSYAWDREMYYGYNTVYRAAITKAYGLSVRCVKDNNE